MGNDSFDYNAAFARNIGWVTPQEQQILRSCRVAIAGLGGVGGSHLLTLTRLGIGAFHIADFDRFEIANFNRQAGASVTTLGQPKADVLARLAREINPELELEVFPDGVHPDNADRFLAGVDVYVDGLDYFAVAARRAVFAACARNGVPAVTAAPLGMGAAVLTFMPGGMTFEEYFRLEGVSEQEQLVRFLLGLSPAMLQRAYLVHPAAVDFAAHRGPSTPMACEICAGLAATETLKIVLHRGSVRAAPHGLQFDAYRNRLARTWRPGGNRNPLQRLAIAIARRQLRRMAAGGAGEPTAATPRSPVERVLDSARWAPSGDNTQPWRFAIHGPHDATIHAFDTREHCVYDLDGHASHLAHGALLETLTIAATSEGLRVEARPGPGEHPQWSAYHVHLEPDPAVEPDPLAPYIPVRATQRRPMRTRALTDAERSRLEAAVGDDFTVHWMQTPAERWRVARLLAQSARIRLTTPEAHAVHAGIIEWGARFSTDRIPEGATGLDPLLSRTSRWALQDWRRARLLNRYLGGTWLPRLELDLLPGLACAAHFLIAARRAPETDADYVAAGRAWQRFWLTATRLGLWSQPEMTPLIFARYAREGRRFTEVAPAAALAQRVCQRLDALFTPETHRCAVVLGRLGAGPAPRSRSLRRPLAALLLDHEPRRP